MCPSLKSYSVCAGERSRYQDFRGCLSKILQYGICAPFFSWEYPNRCILWSCLSISIVVSQMYLIVILWLTSTYTKVHSTIPSFQGGRLQFSVFKFYKLLAVPSYCIYCHCWSVQKKEKWIFSNGRNFSIFQKTCLKCHHSLCHWTRLDSVLFSVWCRRQDLKKDGCADAMRRTLRLLTQSVLPGLNTLFFW